MTAQHVFFPRRLSLSISSRLCVRVCVRSRQHLGASVFSRGAPRCLWGWGPSSSSTWAVAAVSVLLRVDSSVPEGRSPQTPAAAAQTADRWCQTDRRAATVRTPKHQNYISVAPHSQLNSRCVSGTCCTGRADSWSSQSLTFAVCLEPTLLDQSVSFLIIHWDTDLEWPLINSSPESFQLLKRCGHRSVMIVCLSRETGGVLPAVRCPSWGQTPPREASAETSCESFMFGQKSQWNHRHRQRVGGVHLFLSFTAVSVFSCRRRCWSSSRWRETTPPFSASVCSATRSLQETGAAKM